MPRRSLNYSVTPPTPSQMAKHALQCAKEALDHDEDELSRARAQLEAIQTGIGNQSTASTEEWISRVERRVTRNRRKVERLEKELARILAETEKDRLLDAASRYREKYVAGLEHGHEITFALAGMVERLRELLSGGAAPPKMLSPKWNEIREAAEKLAGLSEAESEEAAVPPPPWLDGAARESMLRIRQQLEVVEEIWIGPPVKAVDVINGESLT